MSERLLTANDVRTRLGLGRDATLRLFQTGAIPAVKLSENSRMWRTTEVALQRWLDQQAQPKK